MARKIHNVVIGRMLLDGFEAIGRTCVKDLELEGIAKQVMAVRRVNSKQGYYEHWKRRVAWK